MSRSTTSDDLRGCVTPQAVVCGLAGAPPGPAWVRDAMLKRPKTCGTDTDVARARELFDDDHVHSLLLVRGGRLATVVLREDLVGVEDAGPAVRVGRLDGRVIGPDAALEAVFRTMIERSMRRLAVVDEWGALLGLLCLKRSQVGFCSDADVRARSEGACSPHPAAR